jgi:hypothetical protein
MNSLYLCGMITDADLKAEGWIDGQDNFGNPRLEKQSGRATYYAHVGKRLYIGVFVEKDPDCLWCMSMWSTLYYGDCPTIDDFYHILKLVATYG